MSQQETPDVQVPFRVGFSLVLSASILALIGHVLLSGGQMPAAIQTAPLTVETFWAWLLDTAKLLAVFGLVGAVVSQTIHAAAVSYIQVQQFRSGSEQCD